MPDTYKSYRAFIASPGDVKTEREIAERVISSLNRTLRDTLRFAFDCRKWEHFAPVSPHVPEERLQDLLNREVEEAHCFVLILYKRYGTIEPGHTISNTEREIEAILARYEKDPKIKILSYFKALPTNVDPGDQEAKVRQLRERLERLNVAYREYNSEEEFKEFLTHDLLDVILRFRFATFKYNCLKKFWQFGATERPFSPRLAILYPPLTRNYFVDGKDNGFWLDRLNPPIAVEDYKAIQKLEKHYQILGFNAYRVYSFMHAPAELNLMNRVWLCLPRNNLGLKELQTHVHRRFDLITVPRRKRPQRIRWRGPSGANIDVASPMGMYLKVQRRRMDRSGEWNEPLAKVLAKDYAVLARLRRGPQEGIDEGPLRDYFLAGLRGLGTWGAAWYVDRQYKELQNYGPDEDIELLLEVTYREGRIFSVRNVSSESEGYFRREMSTEVIHENIKQFEAGYRP